MAVFVVDAFEIIKVHEYQGKLMAKPRRAVDFGFQHHAEVSGIVETCAVVCNGKSVDTLEMAFVLEGNRHITSQDGQGRNFIFTESSPARVIGQPEDAKNFFLTADRHKQNGMRVSGIYRVQLAEPAVLADVFQHEWLPVLCRPGANAFV